MKCEVCWVKMTLPIAKKIPGLLEFKKRVNANRYEYLEITFAYSREVLSCFRKCLPFASRKYFGRIVIELKGARQ